MKKPLLVLAVLGALGGGLWWLARRPQGHGSLEGAPEAFHTASLGVGTALAFEDPSLPLRAFRWLGPDASGTVFAQIVTQTDRQELAWFQEGRLAGTLILPRPEGFSAGAFRLQELQDAELLPDRAALLVFRSPTTPGSQWVAVMDLATGATRCSWQTPEGCLAIATDAKGAPQAALVCTQHQGLLRLRLVPPKGTPPGTSLVLPAGEPLPPELPRVTALLALPGGDLAAAGPAGLAIRHGQTWTFTPAPPASPLGFVEPRARLVRANHRIWWQPEPGQLHEVAAEGRPLPPLSLADLGLAGAPEEKDAALLEVLGADPQDRLWFGLAAPLLPKTAEAPPPPVQEEGWTPEGPAATAPTPAASPAFDRTAWETYLAQRLDRLYRWTPGTPQLERLTWTEAWPALQATGFPPPKGGAGLRPGSGWFLQVLGQRAWLAPLSALAWRKGAPVKAPSTP